MKKRIRKLLVANRGEIGVRIMRACRELGIVSVGVFSDVDRRSMHVEFADEAHALGGSTPAETYLNMRKIMEISTRAGVDAIHPGYGFLAENPQFAEEVTAAGLVFVGPSAAAIRRMGDKIAARAIARACGVPTVAGYEGSLEDVRTGIAEAKKIGFPVLIKAAAGGGGKGMRIVRVAEEFESAYRMATSEARASFGDARVYLEKYVEKPRHIEIQVIGDGAGNVIHLGERECSIQRRHQKVIEESPSPAVDTSKREALGRAAVAIAREAGYTNAGTCEFLVDTEGRFFFLEMNTRLQVEHPVTELVTGIDLVHLQIRVAEGEPLGIQQADVQLRGHAIEARIYAEDPSDDFLPSVGTLQRYLPPSGPRVRVESGCREGDEISVFYDPLLAKLITWGRTRDEAITTMRRALFEFQVEGVKTTIPFCAFVVDHEMFVRGLLDTSFVQNYGVGGSFERLSEEELRVGAIAAMLLCTDSDRVRLDRDGHREEWKNLWKQRALEGYR